MFTSFEYWQEYCYAWLVKYGIRKENLNKRVHAKEVFMSMAREKYKMTRNWRIMRPRRPTLNIIIILGGVNCGVLRIVEILILKNI